MIDGIEGGNMTYHSLQIKAIEVFQQRLHIVGWL